MADILELALRRVVANGMSAAEGAAMLEAFARGSGRDIGWSDTVPYLDRGTAERIDWAGTGWMIVQRAEPAPVPEKKLARDGKMLATGEEA
jgi:hypothetical protein